MKNLQFIVILPFASKPLPLLTYAQVGPAPDHGPDEGDGLFERLIIWGPTAASHPFKMLHSEVFSMGARQG